ncbi:MAG: imidazole glycerol phosphate synthase subunit HisH [Thermodesulfobacteriota bacterium]
MNETRPAVVVVDYGIGNLFSVCHALHQAGGEVALTSDPNRIAQAERLVLPGVGAIADGMAGLRQHGLVAPIRELVARDKPFLGICLGMQMMLDVSEEFGEHECLGLIPGRVVPVPPTGADGRPHKIPHIGWNELFRPEGGDWSQTLLAGIPERTTAYFVHSFMAMPTDPGHRLADCLYDGRVVSAAIRIGKAVGTQFHPEKSGPAGIQMLKNFLALQ